VKKIWKWPRRNGACFHVPADSHDARLSLSELEEALRSVEPAARLVPPRLLRRVIRVDASLGGFGFRVPHSKTYVVASAALLEIVDRSELDLQPDEKLPSSVILLERPGGDDLEELSRQELLLHYWELLFHARVHCEFQRLVAEGRFDADKARQRIDKFGRWEFEEVRTVLQQERFLFSCCDDTAVYVEFAAVYAGIRYFQPLLLASFFPALMSPESVDRLIAQDIDAGALLAAMRLPGTPEPEELREAARKASEAFDAEGSRHTPCAVRPQASEDYKEPQGGRHATRERVPGACYFPRIPVAKRSEKKYLNWSKRAAHHAARGNFAGAAIRRARAEHWAPREQAAEAATALRDEVHRFVERLQIDLGVQGDDPRPWRESLLALAHQTPRGLWTVEARLLYDLQKACIDKERATSAVDVMHWILSLGRRAIRRDLPDQRRVAMSRHLRSAQRRLARVRISDHQRRQLADVLGAATTAAEARLRDELRPKIAAALDEIDLRPKNLPEEISRRKIVEELLDRIVERGFLTLGEVRDAISRNHLKELDCSGARNFLRGEAAIRADRRLTDALDGVYEPGDFYLRWLLRFSHLMFGTAVGRLLTQFFVIPFGGAYVALKGSDHLIELVSGIDSHLAPEHWTLADLMPLAVSSVFLGMLIHVSWFRGAVWQGLKWLGRAVRFLLVDSLRWFLTLPWVQMIVHSAVVRLIMNLIVKPVVPTLIVARFLPANMTIWQKLVGLASMYVGLILVVNSRVGRDLEEMALDAIGEGWQRFGVRPLLGLFWFIVDLFRRLLQVIERILYTVDEWLRFRSGQSRIMLVAKGTLGVIWFFVAYLVRFCVNLLIEPQLNPLKHVPWVSVSHKIMAPIWYQMGLPGFLRQWMSPLAADVMTFIIVFGTPGIFGFLIWELKENWRLFAANRPKNLRPVLIGGHGETMLRLLRPGFHSGTIPKQFAKLRRAERKALRSGESGAARKHREMLHHVEIYLQRYIEREFIAWFAAGDGGNWPSPRVRETRLATSEATIEVELPQPSEEPLIMSFRFDANGIQLELSGRLCLERWPPAAYNIFRLALVNVLKTASSESLVRGERLDAPDNAPRRQEVGSIVVAWADWVAAWENADRSGKIPWKIFINPQTMDAPADLASAERKIDG
jgi:hypothetical protein